MCLDVSKISLIMTLYRKIRNKLNEKKFKIKRSLYYFLFRAFFKKPLILSKEETIKKIIEDKISVSRFGDGEYSLMLGHDTIGFQDGSKEISNALKEVFNIRDDRVLISIMPLCDEKDMHNIYGNTIKTYVLKNWADIKNIFDYKYIYGNSYISRFYHPHIKYSEKRYQYIKNNYIPLLKKIWENKNILIIEGKNTKLGVGNDLFENAMSIKRIICPSKNAFARLDTIHDLVIKNKDKIDVVLMSLGPTATILSAKLAIEADLQCIDVGHIDIVYMWMMDRAKTKIKYAYKDMNEVNAPENEENGVFENDKYNNEIIARI